jgi:kumamolisin
VADSPLEKALEAARVAGVTVCVSASDWGSSNTRGPSMMLPGAAPDGGAHVCYPASSPLVLACGGTELMEMEDGSGVQTERVWNNAVKDGKAAERGGATGGGVSRQFDIPEWQTRAGVRIDCVSTGKTGRVVPDVAGLAAAADWKIYVIGHGVSPDGGTSAVAPLWASLILMANQLRAEAGKGPLGHVNERLYELAAAGGVFRDVTVGDNRSAPAYPCYAAGPGFDACTGWGAPEGEALIKALVALD